MEDCSRPLPSSGVVQDRVTLASAVPPVSPRRQPPAGGRGRMSPRVGGTRPSLYAPSIGAASPPPRRSGRPAGSRPPAGRGRLLAMLAGRTGEAIATAGQSRRLGPMVARFHRPDAVGAEGVVPGHASSAGYCRTPSPSRRRRSRRSPGDREAGRSGPTRGRGCLTEVDTPLA